MLYLATFVVTTVALRTFVGEETRTVPRENATRNFGWFLLNYVVGYLVIVIVVSVGLVLLVVPGVILEVSLYVWSVYVAVEDENFVSAFRDSWTLTRGNRWSLLGLGLVVVAGGPSSPACSSPPPSCSRRGERCSSTPAPWRSTGSSTSRPSPGPTSS